MATNRLGKGLGALLGTEVDIKGKDKRFVTIDIKKIKPNPNQARKTFDEAEIEDLANSVSQKGVIYPVLLTEKADGTYMIVAGERRYRAAKKVGLKEIPAIIENLDEREIMEVSLIENIQRVNL
ncbi:MAG: ParB/RepB/Spo0J family partition protein, partial [Clostridia bacterium]|nr:ParB/RepB/Spo0J family partition protein [Clostridia bacterium]